MGSYFEGAVASSNTPAPLTKTFDWEVIFYNEPDCSGVVENVSGRESKGTLSLQECNEIFPVGPQPQDNLWPRPNSNRFTNDKVFTSFECIRPGVLQAIEYQDPNNQPTCNNVPPEFFATLVFFDDPAHCVPINRRDDVYMRVIWTGACTNPDVIGTPAPLVPPDLGPVDFAWSVEFFSDARCTQAEPNFSGRDSTGVLRVGQCNSDFPVDALSRSNTWFVAQNGDTARGPGSLLDPTRLVLTQFTCIGVNKLQTNLFRDNEGTDPPTCALAPLEDAGLVLKNGGCTLTQTGYIRMNWIGFCADLRTEAPTLVPTLSPTTAPPTVVPTLSPTAVPTIGQSPSPTFRAFNPETDVQMILNFFDDFQCTRPAANRFNGFTNIATLGVCAEVLPVFPAAFDGTLGEEVQGVFECAGPGILRMTEFKIRRDGDCSNAGLPFVFIFTDPGCVPTGEEGLYMTLNWQGACQLLENPDPPVAFEEEPPFLEWKIEFFDDDECTELRPGLPVLKFKNHLEVCELTALQEPNLDVNPNNPIITGFTSLKLECQDQNRVKLVQYKEPPTFPNACSTKVEVEEDLEDGKCVLVQTDLIRGNLYRKVTFLNDAASETCVEPERRRALPVAAEITLIVAAAIIGCLCCWVGYRCYQGRAAVKAVISYHGGRGGNNYEPLAGDDGYKSSRI